MSHAVTPRGRPELSGRQRYALAAAARDADSGRRTRAAAVRRWYEGHSQADAAAGANVSPTTIRRWVRRFQETGTIPKGQSHQAEPTTLHSPRGSVVTATTRRFLATLAAELLAERRSRGWSRAQVLAASGVGYSPAILGHWERGSRAMPLIAFAILCHALGIDPGEVIRRCYDESFARVHGFPDERPPPRSRGDWRETTSGEEAACAGCRWTRHRNGSERTPCHGRMSPTRVNPHSYQSGQK